MAEAWYPVASAPAYGDIVWGRFPTEVPGPGPKKRPVLILATAIHERNGQEYATVQGAYGTSKLRLGEPRAAFDLLIQNYNALSAARLPQATRFDIHHARWLPWSSGWFEPRTGSDTPHIGKLQPDYIQRLELLRVARKAFIAQVEEVRKSRQQIEGEDRDDEY